MNPPVVVVKLVSGEQLMGFLLDEGKDGIVIEMPIAIRNINITTDKGIIEKTVTSPFCNITDETVFEFEWEHIIFVKSLHPALVTLYLDIVSDEEDGENDLNDEDLMNIDTTDAKKTLH